MERPRRSPTFVARAMLLAGIVLLATLALPVSTPSLQAQGPPFLSLACDPDLLPQGHADACRALRRNEGRRLFDQETFGGNGRTCVTCHSRETGTFSPADALQRLLQDPTDPLFVHDGQDEGGGITRILQHATVRIVLPLPPHISIAGQPDVRHIVVNRGTPSAQNTPALDPALMYDIRDADLRVQARGAIQAHAQNTVVPTDLQLELLAEFQRTEPRFFSSPRLREFARTGVPPTLPEGTTDSEKRGRLFFIDAPFEPGSTVGVCGLCHSGPMLNRTNEFSEGPPLNSRRGAPIQTAGVSEANLMGNPVHTFLVADGRGEPVPVTTPDLGILLTDRSASPVLNQSLPPVLPPGARLAFFANFFKISSLWGVAHTAPYFHDNSAKDLDEMLLQYDWFFANRMGGQVTLTPQDKEDIKAFLRLL
jgi:hypothetical protein